MAGTVVALDNTYGTVGVAPGILDGQRYMRLVCSWTSGGGGNPDPFFGAPGSGVTCDPQALATQLNWAAANLGPPAVINISLGWSTVNPAIGLAAAVAAAWDDGQLLVAAVGNSSTPTVYYPAGYSQVLGVSGVKQDTSFGLTSSCGIRSSQGPHVSIAAPFETYGTNSPSAYGTRCGTSFASPHVAGVAALVWSYYTAWTNQRLKEHLLVSALDRLPAGWDDSTGYGLVHATLSDVFAPPLLTGTIQSGRPRLTWNAVPAAVSYTIYHRVTPVAPTWTYWGSTTSTAYTDWATKVTSFYGYDSIPAGTAVGYYVVAVSASGIESQVYTRYATYIPNGVPPY